MPLHSYRGNESLLLVIRTLRYRAEVFQYSFKVFHTPQNKSVSNCKMHFIDNLLNNETIQYPAQSCKKTSDFSQLGPCVWSWDMKEVKKRIEESRRRVALVTLFLVLKKSKTYPSALLSYISTLGFLRTRENCFSHFSSVLKNSKVLI